MKTIVDKTVGTIVAVAAIVLGVLSKSLSSVPIWIPIVMGALGALSGALDFGWWSIPDQWKRLVGGILGAASAAMATLQAADPNAWVPIVLAIITALGGFFGVGVWKRPGRAAA
jgi:hypothetical protein